MFHKNRTRELKENVAGRGGVAVELAEDRKFRAHVSEAMRHASDAWLRAQKKQHPHRTRNRMLKLLAGGGAAAAALVPGWRRALMSRARGLDVPEKLPGMPQTPRVITESIEVDVPVSTAYNQWTQFEEFPQFMDGVEEVRQLDDTLLHWVGKVAGKRAEWDAKIVEQHRDRQITWVSEDGKTTRGTVSFETVSPTTTRISLSMSYMAGGVRELVGSAAGLDARRVRGDLERFKEFIEGRGAETGAWRGDVSAGATTGDRSTTTTPPPNAEPSAGKTK
jgi:uncharacterized membrane protein